MSDIHDAEIRKLRVFKYILHVVSLLSGLAIIYAYTYYYVLSCHKEDYYTSSQ